MTERERWIVYPLLFLALGVALRDKFVGTTTRSIHCQELVVEDEASGNEQPRVIAKIGRFDASGRIEGLSVDGVINAKQYALLGNIFLQPPQVLLVPHGTLPIQPMPNQQPGTPPMQRNTAPGSPSTSKSGAGTAAPAGTAPSPGK
jgi:hypothetical protein